MAAAYISVKHLISTTVFLDFKPQLEHLKANLAELARHPYVSSDLMCSLSPESRTSGLSSFCWMMLD